MTRATILERDGERVLVLPKNVRLMGEVDVQVSNDRVVVSRPIEPSAEFKAARAAKWAEVDELMAGDRFAYVEKAFLKEFDWG